MLLEELLFLEVELRRDGGETPSPADYLARFPAASGEIHAVFAQEDASGRTARSVARI